MITQIIVAIVASLALLLTIPLFFPFRWPAAFMWGVKILISPLSPILILFGALTAILGWATHSPLLIDLGVAVVVLNVFHFISITRAPNNKTGFGQAFGSDWTNRLRHNKYFISRRTALRLPSVPRPRFKQNIQFAHVPGINRSLLCDLWQPAENIKRSGLAILYLHGSAFYILDKDFGTRAFFSQLTAQGHVVMDIAYRLAPQTDIQGMVQDVNRAIVWMKGNARYLGVDADHIVLAGGSAGAHLAMLAAYTSGDPIFTPAELVGTKTDVCGVICYYGTSDLETLYYHTNQHLTNWVAPGTERKHESKRMFEWMKRLVGDNYQRFGFDKGFANTGNLAAILGGRPDECPDRYAQFSPITHVHAGCPPTLLIHGKHDIMAPISATYRLHQRLMEEKIPVVLHVLPQTDHGFDLAFPKISPAMHNALYDVEAFLSLIASVNIQSNKLNYREEVFDDIDNVTST